MTDGNDQELLAALKEFYDQLMLYRNTLVKHVNRFGYVKWAAYPSEYGKKGPRLGELRETLVEKSGALKPIVVSQVGGQYTQQLDIWFNALAPFTEPKLRDRLLVVLLDRVKETIGRLEAPALGPVADAEAALGKQPKAFIAHGGKSGARDKLCEFLSALGVQPLIVEELPSKGKAVDDKVEHYLGQADCAIILATADDEIEGKFHPRQNVIHEIGLAQKTFPDKIIYLLEEGAEFPSNISPKIWQRFSQETMDQAFIAIARELVAFGLIRAVKPQ